MPGYVGAGSATNGGQDNFGPITNTYNDFVTTHTAGGTDEWYLSHYNTFVIPSLFTDDHQVVKELLDSSATFPSVGTTWDDSVLFPLSTPIGIVPLIESEYLYDPDAGTGCSNCWASSPPHSRTWTHWLIPDRCSDALDRFQPAPRRIRRVLRDTLTAEIPRRWANAEARSRYPTTGRRSSSRRLRWRCRRGCLGRAHSR
jgi:hypothetical protein